MNCPKCGAKVLKKIIHTKEGVWHEYICPNNDYSERKKLTEHDIWENEL